VCGLREKRVYDEKEKKKSWIEREHARNISPHRQLVSHFTDVCWTRSCPCFLSPPPCRHGAAAVDLRRGCGRRGRKWVRGHPQCLLFLSYPCNLASWIAARRRFTPPHRPLACLWCGQRRSRTKASAGHLTRNLFLCPCSFLGSSFQFGKPLAPRQMYEK